MTGQCLQSQQQTRERSHVSHYQGKVTAYPMTHRFHWPVTTIRHHQPGIIMFNRFYLGATSNSPREWMDFSNYFCLNTHRKVLLVLCCHHLVSLYFHSPLKLFYPNIILHVFTYYGVVCLEALCNVDIKQILGVFGLENCCCTEVLAITNVLAIKLWANNRDITYVIKQ